MAVFAFLFFTILRLHRRRRGGGNKKNGKTSGTCWTAVALADAFQQMNCRESKVNSLTRRVVLSCLNCLKPFVNVSV